MARISQNDTQYWIEHKCWGCGKHSASQTHLHLNAVNGGYLCDDCYIRLFDKQPKS